MDAQLDGAETQGDRAEMEVWVGIISTQIGTEPEEMSSCEKTGWCRKIGGRN